MHVAALLVLAAARLLDCDGHGCDRSPGSAAEAGVPSILADAVRNDGEPEMKRPRHAREDLPERGGEDSPGRSPSHTPAKVLTPPWARQRLADIRAQRNVSLYV